MSERLLLINLKKINDHTDQFSYSMMNISSSLLENGSILINFKDNKIYDSSNK